MKTSFLIEGGIFAGRSVRGGEVHQDETLDNGDPIPNGAKVMEQFLSQGIQTPEGKWLLLKNGKQPVTTSEGRFVYVFEKKPEV